ncbi:MAG: CCA tRNA nucleotidyltransferase [Anaerovoracaceae bacterium]|jgi:tRNA nucleotidyltransferase (CCA-adding enzyme)|nr:CCA tRNA nucleotidyltransferase [Anaerovoracaceae bacterium]
MIKLPKEISLIIKTMDQSGHKCFLVGGCVRDSLLGKKPLDWDIGTEASYKDIIRIFPNGQVISEKYSVVRLEYENPREPDATIIVDIGTLRQEGEYSDFRRPDEVKFTDSIEKDLERRDFTINAMAENPSLGFFDPFSGKEDLKNRKIRMVGDPIERLKQDPSRMLRAVRLVAELNFELDRDLRNAILAQCSLMEHVSKEKILEEFSRILGSEYPGKGLRLLAGLNLMPFIIGEDIALHMTKNELDDFSTYCENIHKTKQNPRRRMGLFYLIFSGKRALKAIEILPHTAKDIQHFNDQIKYMHKIYFIRTKIEFKQFVAKIGLERYQYLQNLAKAQRIVYDLPEEKVLSRDYLLTVIRNEKEPLFVEDLAINGDDLIAAGFEEGEGIGQMLYMLLDAVHLKPQRNEKKELLKLAKVYKKSWLRRTSRNVTWLK